jgi:hypothetical protein
VAQGVSSEDLPVYVVLTRCESGIPPEWQLLVEFCDNLIVLRAVLQVSRSFLPAAVRNPTSKCCKMATAMTTGLGWDLASPSSLLEHLGGLSAEVWPRIVIWVTG